MPQYRDPYCFGYREQDDGTFTFECSDNVERFRWLALPPRHPAVIQTQNFWGSIGAMIERDGEEASKWTALTWTDWQCGQGETGRATHGTYKRVESEGGPAFAMVFFDGENREIVRMRGRGVVFRNRNFEKWREQSKSAAREKSEHSAFVFARRASLGLSEREFAFLAPLDAADATSINALVTRENGLPPHNPYLSGTGDHVNTTHFAEAARQAACLVSGDPDIAITGGEMSLTRYVELGTAFRLNIAERGAASLKLELEQLDRPCAQIDLRWQADRPTLPPE